MTYGVKVLHTRTIGDNKQRFYEELVLKVQADSFDEAYDKAERYMQNAACEYINIHGDTVKTENIEAVNCFLAFEAEGDVQEIYSSFSTNCSSLSQEDYHQILASSCDENELQPLRNKDFHDGSTTQ